MTDTHYLVLSTLLAWIMVMTAAELHTPTWTRVGFKLAFGNREKLPERSPLAARADRAAKNMLENLLFFVGAFAAVHAVGVEETLGAATFFWARVAYFAVYLVGVPYLRTAIWGVSLGGLGLMFARALGHA